MAHICRKAEECKAVNCPHSEHHDYRNQGKYNPPGQQGLDVDMCDAPCDVRGGIEGASCVLVKQ